MGGSGASTATPYSVNEDQLAKFISTQEGQQYAGQYVPGATYSQIGTSIQRGSAGDPTDIQNQKNNSGWGAGTLVGPDVSSMMAAFNAWVADQSNANQTWQNYSDLIAKEAGGEGQDTILAKAASNPYQSLLAAQQNAGVVGNPAAAKQLVPSRKGYGAP